MSVDIYDVALKRSWEFIVKAVEKSSEGVASKVEFDFNENQINVYWKGDGHFFGGNHALIIDLTMAEFHPESNYDEEDETSELTGSEKTWGVCLKMDVWFCIHSDNKYINPLFFDDLKEQKIDYIDRVAMPFAHEEEKFQSSLSVIRGFYSALENQISNTNIIIENEIGVEGILSKSFGYVFKDGKPIDVVEYFNINKQAATEKEKKCWQPKLPTGIHKRIKDNVDQRGSNLKIAYQEAVEQFLDSYEHRSIDYFASRASGSEQSIWLSAELSKRIRKKAEKDGVSGNRVLYTAIMNYHNNLPGSA